MFRTVLVAAWFAVALSIFAGAARAITLVKDGQPVATIIIAEKALQATRYTRTLYANGTPEAKIRSAAEDLQLYLEKISGAKVPMVSDVEVVDAKSALILVGESARTAKLPLRIPTGVTKDFLEEGYVLYCKGNTLVLAGNNTEKYHGTEYAVYDFLHRLGARWYMPGDYGEYLPSLKTISFADVNIRETPDFRMRLWWQNASPEMQAADAEFKIRNRMDIAPVLPSAGDGTLRDWLPDEKYLTTHPEYFAKNPDGSVYKYMINLTHPEVPALVAEKMKAAIQKQMDKGILVPSVAIAPDDGYPVDFTPETMKGNLGFTDLAGRFGAPGEVSVSEEWFRFVNKVAELVVKDYPNALIGTNGYSNRNIPPEGMTLHPNLTIMYAAIWSDNIHAMNSPLSWQTNVKGNIMQRWCQLNSRVWLYDYDFQMLASVLSPIPGVRKLVANMPLMKKWGMAGFLNEARNSYMEEGIQTKYLRARMMWDADLKVNEVLDDYYRHWYGAAAAPARAFWDEVEEVMEKTPILGHEDRVLPFVYTPELISRMEKHLVEAEKLAADERNAQHVKADRLILEHLKAYMAMHDAEFAGKYAEAAVQAEALMAGTRELTKFSSFYCVPEDQGQLRSAVYYWSATDRKKHYQKVDDLMNGTAGKLIALAPKGAKFRLDPGDIGRFEQWHSPEYDRAAWQTADSCVPFYLQAPNAIDKRGMQYLGAMWYVFEMNVPEDARGKRINLYAPIVVDDAWVWVNGTFAGHRGHLEPYTRPAELRCDGIENLLQPGKPNVIAVRVHTGLCPAAVADGFMGRLFLYTPTK